jgi:superfamily II DNA helicase RecQ
MRSPTELDRFIIDQAPAGNELRIHLKEQYDRGHEPGRPSKGSEQSGGRVLSEEETIAVKKILSCVVRLKGRFGKGTVAAVLRGSRSKQVIENRLNKLSTYGLLVDMSQDEVTLLIRELIKAGCISVGRGAYPTVYLTDFGREVMTGRAIVELTGLIDGEPRTLRDAS